MVAKESKVSKKDKTPKKEKTPKTKKEEEEEDVPETEPVTKQDKKEKKNKKEKKAKKEESEEEKEEKKDKKKKEKKEKKAKKEESEEEKEEEKEEEEEQDNKRKRDEDDEETAQDEQPAKSSKSDGAASRPVVFASRLSFQIQEEGLKEFFSDAGEIESIEWINDASEKFCGGAKVTFADMDAAQKALAKTGQELDGRNVSVDGYKEIPAECVTLFVGGMPKNLIEEDYKQLLADNSISFSSVRFPTDKFSGEYKGIAFIDFETTEQLTEAYYSNIRSIGFMGRVLNYDPSTPRPAGDRPAGGRGGFGGDRGGRGGRGGFGDRGGRGGRGGFGGGRGGRGGFGGDRGRGGFGGRGGRGGFGGGRGGGFGGKKTTFDE